MKKCIAVLCVFMITSISCAIHAEFDEVKEKFESDQQKFERIRDVFLKHQTIVRFVRQDYNRLHGYEPFFCKGKYNLSYLVYSSFKSQGITILIPDAHNQDDISYVRTNLDSIKDTGRMYLKQYLTENKIDQDFFFELLEFMAENNIFSISTLIDSRNSVQFNFTLKEGLIWISEPSVLNDGYFKFIKIKQNWYYYIDKTAFI